MQLLDAPDRSVGSTSLPSTCPALPRLLIFPFSNQIDKFSNVRWNQFADTQAISIIKNEGEKNNQKKEEEEKITN